MLNFKCDDDIYRSHWHYLPNTNSFGFMAVVSRRLLIQMCKHFDSRSRYSTISTMQAMALRSLWFPNGYLVYWSALATGDQLFGHTNYEIYIRFSNRFSILNMYTGCIVCNIVRKINDADADSDCDCDCNCCDTILENDKKLAQNNAQIRIQSTNLITYFYLLFAVETMCI